jgi:hypothetical protein
VRAHTVAAIAIPATLALAPAALAQETNVTTFADSAKIGAEFRAEAIYDNHGLEKVKGYDPDASTTVGVTKARIKIAGNLNKETTYAFRFNLLDPHKTGTPLDYGYGTHWFTDMFGFTFGKAKVHQGGWDNMNGNFRDHAKGALFDNLVFPEYTPMIAVQAKVAGLLQLQIVDDVVAGEDATASYNKTQHPTWILGWKGDLGGINPIVDIGSYDNNKSMYVDIGVAAVMGGLNASLDYFMNNHTISDLDSSGKQKDFKDTASNIALKVRYDAGPVTPGLYFATYDNKQASDSKVGKKDLKYNTTYDATSGAMDPQFDDNGQVAGIWVDVNTMGKGWTPYLAVVNKSGKFQKDPTSTKEESRSDMQVKLGVLGDF